MKIDIDVEGATKVGPALRRGLSDGLEDTGKTLLEEGEDKARDEVMGAGRVWNEEVKHGFESEGADFQRFYHWKGKIFNPVKHADVVDRGLAPEGEITGSNPSVQDIMPWVVDNITPDADAQAKAEKANIGNWDPQLQALAVQNGKANVIAAFAIRDSIDKDGFPGIHFTDTTEAYLKQVGVMMIKNKVEKHMNRELRKAGLK